MKSMDLGAEINSNFFFLLIFFQNLKKKNYNATFFLGLLQSIYHLVGIEI